MSMPHSWTYPFPVWMGGWTSNHEQQDTRALGFERVSSLSFFPVKYYIPLVNEESYGIDGPFSSLIYRRWWFSIGIASSRGRAYCDLPKWGNHRKSGCNIGILFGGLEHFLFFQILGISSSQLTHIFQRGRQKNTNQYIKQITTINHYQPLFSDLLTTSNHYIS